MQKRHLVGVALAAGALILAGCGTGSSGSTNGAGKSQHGIVNISGQNFPEAQIMAEIYATVLRANGYTPSLKLVDTRFYHLDTCFCPLEGGFLLYYPPAFDDDSRAEIERRVPAARRIAIAEEDALAFACNAVGIDSTVIVNRATPALARTLARDGFEVVQTPLSEFMKAGGSAKCLTLRLDELE